MVHTFKFGGQRIAYDNVSGLVLPLTELAYKMLDYIELPMQKECSSALRYDLAKYDSAAIGSTYDLLYSLYADGKLFAEGEGSASEANLHGAAIKLGEKIITRTGINLYETVLDMVNSGEDVTLSVVPVPDGAVPFTGADIPTLTKELEKIAKAQVKSARSEDCKPFTAFTAHEPIEHCEECCLECWANKLCSICEPHNAMCELERKRIECTMLCETAK